MFNWFGRSDSTDTQKSQDAQRWIALDLETTGLDPKNDRIIEIGAVAINDGAVDLHDYFHRVLIADGAVSAENRVVHGVTAAEQSFGANLVEALQALLTWMQDAPLIGFHTTFDIGFLRAAIGQHIAPAQAKRFAQNYLDLAVIAPLVFPAQKARSLGEWSVALKLPIRKQHRALADALATAHLLQKTRAALPPTKRTLAELKTLESGRRWL
jgi:DNA polymerase III subunit epsilon